MSETNVVVVTSVQPARPPGPGAARAVRHPGDRRRGGRRRSRRGSGAAATRRGVQGLQAAPQGTLKGSRICLEFPARRKCSCKKGHGDIKQHAKQEQGVSGWSAKCEMVEKGAMGGFGLGFF